jgi:hypothetical protein
MNRSEPGRCQGQRTPETTSVAGYLFAITCYLVGKVQTSRLAVACLLSGKMPTVLPLDISPHHFNEQGRFFQAYPGTGYTRLERLSSNQSYD